MVTNKIKSIILNAYESNNLSEQVVNIFVNHNLVHTSKIFNGYDSQYEQYAIKWLRENIFTTQANNKINCECFWRSCGTLNIPHLSFKSYVSNKNLKRKGN